MLSKKFFNEGLIFQNNEQFFIAEGPFTLQDSRHPTKPCFYLSDFFLQKGFFIWSPKITQIHRDNLLDFLNSYKENYAVPPWIEPCFNDFKNQFHHFQKAVQSSHLTKVVPVVFSKSSLTLSETYKAFLLKNLLQTQKKFIYGYWGPKEGFLGLTPEFLFKKENKTLHTMALAGTAQKSDTHFMKNPKEIKEHQIVVQDIEQRWKGFSIQKSKMYESAYGNLKHLRTDIMIQSNNLHFLSIVKKMHPTPALGGFPRNTALQWLKTYNKIPRKYFGSPFAVLFPNGNSFCLTAIRNIQWTPQSILLGSGCGLTQNSLLEKEWLELKLKRKSVIQYLWAVENLP